MSSVKRPQSTTPSPPPAKKQRTTDPVATPTGDPEPLEGAKELGEPEPKEEPDTTIVYQIVLSISGCTGSVSDIQDQDDENSITICSSKEAVWDDDASEIFIPSWVEGEEQTAPISPITPPSTSPPPDPQNMLTLEQLQLLDDQTVSSSSDSEKETSTASSRSRLPSATPPPAAVIYYVCFYWQEWQALFTCNKSTPTSEMSNIKLCRLGGHFTDEPDEVSIYFQNSRLGDEMVVDDNGNRFLVGYINWGSMGCCGDGPFATVKAYGKKILADEEEAVLSAAERERIVRPHRERMEREEREAAEWERRCKETGETRRKEREEREREEAAVLRTE